MITTALVSLVLAFFFSLWPTRWPFYVCLGIASVMTAAKFLP